MRVWLMLALIGCGSSATPTSQERKLCREAVDRYEQCLGPEAATDVKRLASGPSCADASAQAAFRECLPKETCDEFVGCVMGHAMR